MKRPFLVVHDYGTGGLWAYVWAESEEEINRALNVDVVHELPDWLLKNGSQVVSVDVDHPPDWLLPD